LHDLAQPTTINITKELEAATTTLENLEMMEKKFSHDTGLNTKPSEEK
jgi:hypothetical protein